MNDINEEMRAIVRELRWQRKYSYRAIAQKASIKPRSFYNWLQGYFNFSVDSISRLEKAINDLRGV